MFELYRNDKFVLYYEIKISDWSDTLVLRFKDLSTSMFKSLWIDEGLEEIQNLQDSKNMLQPDEYNHEVACLIEMLIKTGCLNSLEFSSSSKDILRHHKNPQALYDTLNNISSPAKKKLRWYENDRQDERVKFLELVKSLKEFICNSFEIVNSGQDLKDVESDEDLYEHSSFAPQ